MSDIKSIMRINKDLAHSQDGAEEVFGDGQTPKFVRDAVDSFCLQTHGKGLNNYGHRDWWNASVEILFGHDPNSENPLAKVKLNDDIAVSFNTIALIDLHPSFQARYKLPEEERLTDAEYKEQDKQHVDTQRALIMEEWHDKGIHITRHIERSKLKHISRLMGDKLQLFDPKKYDNRPNFS